MAKDAPTEPLSPRFEEALAMASRLHARQRRKGGDVPYVSHLLAVASLVLEQGGSEDEAIAALLHDAAEDQGGRDTLARIHACFGEAVATIVAECSDSLEEPRPPWRRRKQAYIAAIPGKSPSARLVSLADKLHNARCVLGDYRAVGEALWHRFTAPKQEVLWYYGALAAAFAETGPEPLASELRRVVRDLEVLAAD